MISSLEQSRIYFIIDYLERDWKLGQLTQCNTYTPRYGGKLTGSSLFRVIKV